MKTLSLAVLVSVAALAVTASTSAAQTTDEHAVVVPEQIEWGPAPPSLPPGAEAAVLYGDPSKEGLFALRLKMPAGYAIAPHTHPKPEVVTIISGTPMLGMGETADESKAETLPAGSFFALAPDMAHFVVVESDTVIQLNSNGPWSLTYVNPEDDPRQTSQ